MEKLNSIISSYQQKICKHDRQLWEQSYEKELFQKLHSVPRKVAKINTSLIDVDLFRGSAFSVSKSQTGWLSVATVAWFRLVFFPLYYRWWLCSTCSSVFALLCVLYVFQVGSLVICYTDSRQSQSSETLTVADYVTPYIMMYVLTVVHSHITANYNIPLRHFTFTGNNKREKMPQTSRVKRSQSHTAEKFERPTRKHVVCNCSKQSQDEQNLVRSLPCERNQLLVSGASSYSLPCSESSEKISVSKSKILQRTEDWVGSKSFSGSPEWISEGISETKSCQNFQSERGSDLEFLNLDRAVSDLTKTPEGNGWQSENVRSSRESVAAKSSLCSSVTAGSVLTVVGSSFEEMTIAEENIDQGISQPPHEAESLSKTAQNDLSKESGSQGKTARRVAQSHRTLETQTDYSHSCFLLSALESKFEERSSDVLSIADSNTSMSDTCNSSFVSSADEDDEEKAEVNSGDQNPSADDGKPYISEFVRNASCGARQRRKANCRATMLSSDKSSPCKTFDSGSFQGNVEKSFRLSASGYADKQKRGLEAMEAAAAAASSDEDESHLKSCAKLRGQLMRQSAMRKSGVGRRRKSGGADVLLVQKISADKVSDSQHFSRRRVQQCESDAFDKKTHSLPFLKKVKLPECDEDDDVKMVKMKLLLSRTSGLNCSADRKQTIKNAAVNVTESSTTGLGSSSIINCISSNTDKVSCMIWSSGGAVHKVDLTILDIGWTIVRAVDCQQERCDYMVLGLLMSFLNMCTPSAYRLYHNLERENQTTCTYANSTQLLTSSYASLILGQDFGQMAVLINGLMQRLFLSLLFFFLLSVAERTFKQRLLYAKYFCYLTSSRKAKKYDLPHFRLNKVRNIKSWLSLRSFLKKRGPQRSVESVVSTAFILAVILVSILCIELLQDYGHFLEHLGNWELVLWSMILGVYLLRFITLGTKINKKYRNLSVLITEQINLYLHMEQKPHKKEALMVANSVLKLAEDLLKELESPFKISGLSANPFLYNITKVVILSAFSAVLTELLGFKLKLYKIKIRS